MAGATTRVERGVDHAPPVYYLENDVRRLQCRWDGRNPVSLDEYVKAEVPSCRSAYKPGKLTPVYLIPGTKDLKADRVFFQLLRIFLATHRGQESKLDEDDVRNFVEHLIPSMDEGYKQAINFLDCGRNLPEGTADLAVCFGYKLEENGELSQVSMRRLDEAVRLYRAGKVRKILVTGCRKKGFALAHTQVAMRALMRMNVPREDILLSQTTENTWQEVGTTLDAVREHGFSSVMFISSPYHMDRILRYYEKRSAEDSIDLDVYWTSSPDHFDDFDESDKRQQVVHEIYAILRDHIEYGNALRSSAHVDVEPSSLERAVAGQMDPGGAPPFARPKGFMAKESAMVEMRSEEHIYKMEIAGRPITFRDRGEYGVLEPGVDVIEMGDGEDVSAPDIVSDMDPVNELLADAYRGEIMGRVCWIKGEIESVIHDVYAHAERNLHVARGPSWFGGTYKTYVNLNFGQWCGRKSLRDPFEGQLVLDGYPRVKHGKIDRFSSYDHNDDRRTDSISFAKSYTDGGSLSVDILDHGDGPEREMWNGEMAPCIEIDPSRRGLEQYLAVMDEIYARAERDL